MNGKKVVGYMIWAVLYVLWIAGTMLVSLPLSYLHLKAEQEVEKRFFGKEE